LTVNRQKLIFQTKTKLQRYNRVTAMLVVRKMPKSIKTKRYVKKEGETLFVLSPRIITMRDLEEVVFQEKGPYRETPKRECWFKQVFLIA